MKRFLVVAGLIALVAPAVYAAPTLGQGKPEHGNKANNPAKACKKERTDLGVEAFNKKYGTNSNLKNAFGKCVSGKAKTKAGEDGPHGASNAAKQCKKERTDMGFEVFKTKYGTNPNKANAFGKCVSSKSKASEESHDN